MSIAEKAATTRSRPVRAAQIQRGLYALEKVKSQATYIVSATKPGYCFELNEVRTGKSENYEPVSGNKWGVDFVAGGHILLLYLELQPYRTLSANEKLKKPSRNKKKSPKEITHSFKQEVL